MSITLLAPRASTPPPAAWRHVRRTLTATVFTVATIVGLVIGLQGAAVSPVTPGSTVDGGAPALRQAHR